MTTRKRRHLATVIAERPCGECSVCCTALGVPEVTVPGEPCPHLAPAGGCSIYSQRPKQCVAYQCAWRVGALTLNDRPDMSGFVLSLKLLLPGLHVLDCIEVKEGAVDARFEDVLAAAVRLGWPLSVKYLHTPEGVYLYGPGAEELIAQLGGFAPDVTLEERNEIEKGRSTIRGSGKFIGVSEGVNVYVLPSGAGMHRLFLG